MCDYGSVCVCGLDKRQARRARRRAALTPDGFMRAITERKYLSRTMQRSLVKARKWESTLIEQPCSAGNCVELIDPKTGENTGGWGPVGCPCQDDPERNSRDAEGDRND